jgi:hypothetical protein
MQYKVSFTVERWGRVVIDADSEEQVREKFWAQDFDYAKVEQFGMEVQDSVDVEEVTA